MLDYADDKNESDYWNEFYSAPESSTRRLSLPSQFAVFVGGELLEDISTIVEIGCGNGRDSSFFANIGLNVIGVDSSSSAISNCKALVQGQEHVFLVSDIQDSKLSERLQEALSGNRGAKAIYSRFFLHAIDIEAQDRFFNLLEYLCRANELVALEFRTIKDAQLSKETSSHYRRYIDPLKVVSDLSERGFTAEYFAEGFGFAKYKADDAHVCRLILRKL